MRSSAAPWSATLPRFELVGDNGEALEDLAPVTRLELEVAVGDRARDLRPRQAVGLQLLAQTDQAEVEPLLDDVAPLVGDGEVHDESPTAASSKRAAKNSQSQARKSSAGQ